ncbi:MAG: chemotaxis protein CheX [Treponema sp.]|nr:chemotaxis protein CheX [Treponema sp.]
MKQYIEPFIKTCKHVFKEFLNLDLEANLPFFIEREAPLEWDISAVIGLTGEARGAVVISMKEDLAGKLTTILTGTEYTSLDADVVDAVGEIINIIAGNVKHELEEAFRLVISLPTIVKGKGHSIAWPEGQARVICIPFSVSDYAQNFTLSVALEATEDN